MNFDCYGLLMKNFVSGFFKRFIMISFVFVDLLSHDRDDRWNNRDVKPSIAWGVWVGF